MLRKRRAGLIAGTFLQSLGVILLLAGAANGGDRTSIDVLYGRNDGEDQYGVQYLDLNDGLLEGAAVYVGVLSVIDRRYEKYTSADLELGVRLHAGGKIQPWIGLAGTFGFSATREKGTSDYENDWQAGVMPEAGIDLPVSENAFL